MLVGASSADCAAAIPAARIAQEISLGEAAFINMEQDEFTVSYEAVQGMLGCLTDPLNTAQAMAYWRLEALEAFLARDEQRARLALRAVLDITPSYSLSETVAPIGHPLQAWFEEELMQSARAGAPLDPPRSGTLWIDGDTRSAAPVDRPYIFQLTDQDGIVELSTRVPIGELPPHYPVSRRLGVHMPLAVTAGLSGVLAGGTWYLAAQREQAFWDPQTQEGELPSLQQQANTLGAVSLSAGVLAVGAGAAAVIVGSW